MSELDDLSMAVGWKYSISIVDTDAESVGIFKGYSIIGGESAVVIEMEKGVLRQIPVAGILFVDLIESGEREKKEEKLSESVYYG